MGKCLLVNCRDLLGMLPSRTHSWNVPTALPLYLGSSEATSRQKSCSSASSQPRGTSHPLLLAACLPDSEPLVHEKGPWTDLSVSPEIGVLSLNLAPQVLRVSVTCPPLPLAILLLDDAIPHAGGGRYGDWDSGLSRHMRGALFEKGDKRCAAFYLSGPGQVIYHLWLWVFICKMSLKMIYKPVMRNKWINLYKAFGTMPDS